MRFIWQENGIQVILIGLALFEKKKKAVLRDGSILQTAVQRKILTDVKMKAEKSVKDKDIIFSLFYPIFIQMSPLF